MKATLLTTDEIRNSDGRNYNPYIWDKKINNMISNFRDVLWYIVPKGNGYDYDRYFVEYTTGEGLRLFSDFGYSSSLTAGGFYRLNKTPITKDNLSLLNLIDDLDSEKIQELMKELNDTKFFDISHSSFNDSNGNEVLFDTTKLAIKEMTRRSIKYGMVFTKG